VPKRASEDFAHLPLHSLASRQLATTDRLRHRHAMNSFDELDQSIEQSCATFGASSMTASAYCLASSRGY
jgi:hypothetical protein